MIISVINTVPLNGGDEALLQATLQNIYRYITKPDVHIFCNKPIETIKWISRSDLNFHRDWEYTLSERPQSLWDKVKYKTRNILDSLGIERNHVLSTLFAAQEEKEYLAILKSSALVICGAGGYLNDYYGFKNRLLAFEIISRLGKPLVFLGQSFGPFHKYPSPYHNRLARILNQSCAIICREELSADNLSRIGCNLDNATYSTDIAFQLLDEALYRQEERGHTRLVMNFRNWPYTHPEVSILDLATRLCSFLIAHDFEITFLSTCQGIPEYIQDSQMASAIENQLPIDQKTHFKIDNNKYHPTELIQCFQKFDAYVGMRLHGAILSMLSGTPAFNIAYEDKTAGVFRTLGLEDNQIHFSRDVETIQKSVLNFVRNTSNSDLLPRLIKARDLSKKSFDFLETFR